MEDTHKSRRETLEEKNRHLSYVGFANSNSAIWGQYETLVDFIFETYSTTNRRYDEIALPLLNTLSHSLELAMKENIVFFNQYSETKSMSDADLTSLIKSHDLLEVAKEFKSAYNRVLKKLKVDSEQKKEFNRYYTKLEKFLKILNRSAETYRYAYKISKAGENIKPSIERSKTIDFLELKELYKNSKTFFIGAPNSIGHYTDFIDYKKEHPDFKGGKGFLYCQKLPYSRWYFDDLQRQVQEDQGWIKVRDKIYFDPKTKQNYEFQYSNNDIYIIAVDLSKK